jgi:hypothetical protein
MISGIVQCNICGSDTPKWDYLPRSIRDYQTHGRAGFRRSNRISQSRLVAQMVTHMFVVTALILAAFAAAPLYQTVAKHFEDGFLKSMASHLHINGSHSH